MRKRTSPIWTTKRNKLEVIVKKSYSLAEVLREIGLNPYVSGSRYKSLKERLDKEDIDYSHISLGAWSNLGRNFNKKEIPLEEVMIKNSTYSRYHLKKRLLRDNILKNICNICNIEGEWQGKKLVMILDHINGVNDDHRRENLRMLCPNCNSQQKTFAGKRNKKISLKCKKCGDEISTRSKSKLCKKCY